MRGALALLPLLRAAFARHRLRLLFTVASITVGVVRPAITAGMGCAVEYSMLQAPCHVCCSKPAATKLARLRSRHGGGGTMVTGVWLIAPPTQVDLLPYATVSVPPWVSEPWMTGSVPPPNETVPPSTALPSTRPLPLVRMRFPDTSRLPSILQEPVSVALPFFT